MGSISSYAAPGEDIVTSGAATPGVSLLYSRTDHGPHAAGATFPAAYGNLAADVALTTAAWTQIASLINVTGGSSLYDGLFALVQLLVANASPSITNWSQVQFRLRDTTTSAVILQFQVGVNAVVGYFAIPVLAATEITDTYALEAIITTLTPGDTITAKAAISGALAADAFLSSYVGQGVP